MYNIAKNITSLSSPDSIFASFLLHNHEIIVQQQLTMVHFFVWVTLYMYTVNEKRAACSPMLLRYVPFIAWAVRHLRHWCTPHRGFWSAGKYCAPPNSLGTCTACMKLLGKNSSVSMWLWKVKKGMYEKQAIFDQYFALFQKWHSIWPHNYSGRRIGTHMPSIEWYHFQWPSMTPNLDFAVMIFWTENNSKIAKYRL